MSSPDLRTVRCRKELREANVIVQAMLTREPADALQNLISNELRSHSSTYQPNDRFPPKLDASAFDPLRTLASCPIHHARRQQERGMIGIGNDFGGPELRGSEVAKVLNRAMNIAANERDPSYDDGTQAWINPIFIVPGSVSRPDFEGIKRGHFSRKRKGLVLMIAVPEDVTKKQGAREFVVAALRESVRSAAEHFASKGMSFSTLGAEKIIRAIEREFVTH